MSKDIINIAVVNFNALWGNKQQNLSRIIEYTDIAGKNGVEMIVFPETALSGYDDDSAHIDRGEKMHTVLAETIPGPSTDVLTEIAQRYGIYIIFGMPERDLNDAKKIYNSAAILYPDGKVDSYRKLHLPFSEGNWAVRGDYPVMIDTQWGPVGVSICYDTYCFPELIRYYRAKGARLCLNVTACPDSECTRVSARTAIPAYAGINYLFIASANLAGRDRTSWFIGGSNVTGPHRTERGWGEAHTYVGKMFDAANSNTPGIFMGAVDLSIADAGTDTPFFAVNPAIHEPDFRPAMYKRMYEDLLSDGRWKV
ncbi:carbon-nitrogen hydrolase family protein [Oscillibacter sp. MSJ-2]|uniref:Carbon-nitrogen hydrolase family protein n=1 Tax=Dysosmobacter acutus TaxID=2841504 RepID=A0ABS6FCP0_9FIRM|nr:carbon-nitrogen hydrolase family protein [Dysosmobacter acutus]MBU5628050.1 carbon-nitrogen hydrolase family protein [Dysosmobacter acutus]